MYILRDMVRIAKREAAEHQSADDRVIAIETGQTGADRAFGFESGGQFARREPPASPAKAGHFPQFPKIEVSEIVNCALRYRSSILLAGVAGAVAGLAFGTLSPPRYTVYTDMLIPPSGLQVVTNDVYAPNLQSDSQLLDIESRMRIVTSGNVLRRVADTLDLKNDPEFVGTKWFDVRALLGLKNQNAGDLDVAVVRELSDRLKVARQERSYMVTAAVWAEEPDKAVRIANALTDAFKAELTQADADGAGRATKTLTDRLSELRVSVTEAEDRVEAFKRTNNLQQTATGQLVNTQSMEQINGKLVDAQARLIETASRYRELTEARSDNASPSSGLQSPTLTQLRVQETALKRQVASMSLIFGTRHPTLTNARSELQSVERDIAAETARVLRTAKVDLDQARAVMASLTTDIQSVRSTVSKDDEAQVKLRELERAAAAKASVYQAFLTRAGEAAERQQVDATNIRVVSAAVPPLRRSWPPRNAIMVVGGFVGGVGLGFAVVVGLGLLGAWRRTWATT